MTPWKTITKQYNKMFMEGAELIYEKKQTFSDVDSKNSMSLKDLVKHCIYV